MNGDAAGAIFLLTLLAVMMFSISTCVKEQINPKAYHVCLEAKSKGYPLEECHDSIGIDLHLPTIKEGK